MNIEKEILEIKKAQSENGAMMKLILQKLCPETHVSVNKAGYKTEFYTETVTLVMGIGNHHTADLIMTKDAWEALNNGEKIHITTTEEFKKKYIHKK